MDFLKIIGAIEKIANNAKVMEESDWKYDFMTNKLINKKDGRVIDNTLENLNKYVHVTKDNIKTNDDILKVIGDFIGVNDVVDNKKSENSTNKNKKHTELTLDYLKDNIAIRYKKSIDDTVLHSMKNDGWVICANTLYNSRTNRSVSCGKMISRTILSYVDTIKRNITSKWLIDNSSRNDINDSIINIIDSSWWYINEDDKLCHTDVTKNVYVYPNSIDNFISMIEKNVKYKEHELTKTWLVYHCDMQFVKDDDTIVDRMRSDGWCVVDDVLYNKKTKKHVIDNVLLLNVVTGYYKKPSVIKKPRKIENVTYNLELKWLQNKIGDNTITLITLNNMRVDGWCISNNKLYNKNESVYIVDKNAMIHVVKHYTEENNECGIGVNHIVDSNIISDSNLKLRCNIQDIEDMLRYNG